MWTAELAFDQFKIHRDTVAAAEGTNEATTRIRAIDTLLFDVLGWDKLSVNTETYHRAIGFSDYLFTDTSGLPLILEAKRQDVTFTLPTNRFPAKPVGFGLLAKECPEADTALRQALGYAASLGSRYIAITNGFQWLFTLTFVPNQSVDDRSVLVWESLDAISDRFRLFYDTFGAAGLFDNRSYDVLVARRRTPPPLKLSQRLPLYPAPAQRNTLANQLSVALGTTWEGTQYYERDSDFLRECYVEPKSNTTSLGLSKELISQRFSADQRMFTQALPADQAARLLASADIEKPIVVIGDVGNGKSTFLAYLRHIAAPELFKNYIQLDVNFIDRPDLSTEVAAFVYSELETQLRDRYQIDVNDDSFVRAALNADLNRFKRTSEAIACGNNSDAYRAEELKHIQTLRDDRHRYYAKVFAHIRGSRQQSVAIFFDNLDRRLPEIQEDAYLKASAIARDWSALVFVCLRPATFRASKRFSVMDSVAPKVVVVSPPSIEAVLTRRLKYAARVARGDMPASGDLRVPLSSGIALDLPTVEQFLDCFAYSIRKRSSLVDLFEAISNGNVRELLRHVYAFLISAHLDTQEIIEKLEEDGRYTIPVHHVLKAILFEDSLHYDPTKSSFINLFDVEHADRMEHFTRMTALTFLASIPDVHPSYRYAEVAEVSRYLQQCGYTAEHAIWTLRCLFDGKCIEAKDSVETWDGGVSAVRITALGRYHINFLVSEFQYVDAMIVDTPIMQEDVRKCIGDEQGILPRLDRCELFMQYLDRSCSEVREPTVCQAWNEQSGSIGSRIREIRERVINSAHVRRSGQG